MVKDSELLIAKRRIFSRNHIPENVNLPVSEFIEECDNINLQNKKEPTGFFSFLRDWEFWIKFIQIAYKLFVALVKKNGRHV